MHYVLIKCEYFIHLMYIKRNENILYTFDVMYKAFNKSN